MDSFTYFLDKKGGGEKSTDLFSKPKKNTISWHHISLDCEEGLSWLRQTNLDPVILDALCEEETRPRIAEWSQDSCLIILRGINLNDAAQPEDMISVRLFIEKNRIISTWKRKLKTIRIIENSLSSGTGPKSSGEFLSTLAKQLAEVMFPTLTVLSEKADTLEEEVLETPDTKSRQKIIDLRKEVISYRRYLHPQKDVLQKLKTCEQTWLATYDKRIISETYDRTAMYLEEMEEARERTLIIQDELLNIISDKLNKNTYFLSIIAAIFLPLGFLTGLLGVNIAGMPGASDPNAFWYFCVGLTVLVIIQTYLFKRMKLF